MRCHLVELCFQHPEPLLGYFKQQMAKIADILAEASDSEVLQQITLRVSKLLFLYNRVFYSFSPKLHYFVLELAAQTLAKKAETAELLCFLALFVIKQGQPQHSFIPQILNFLISKTQDGELLCEKSEPLSDERCLKLVERALGQSESGELKTKTRNKLLVESIKMFSELNSGSENHDIMVSKLLTNQPTLDEIIKTGNQKLLPL